MTLQGYQFDKAKVTPEADAQLNSYLAQSSDNKVISGMTATATGLNVYVASGKALVQGRLVENDQQMQLTAQANKTGYVCITVDLTQTNTSTGTPGTSNYLPVNNQLRFELVDILNQQDLNYGGLIYTFPLYSYTSTGTSVSLTKIDKSFRPASTITSITVASVFGISFQLTRVGNMVTVNVPVQIINFVDIGENKKANEVLPLGFRPKTGASFGVFRFANNIAYPVFALAFLNSGEIRFTNTQNGLLSSSGSVSYFTDDAMPVT